MRPILRQAKEAVVGACFGIVDARLYAAFRIALAVVALLNLLAFWPDRHTFFSSTGMVDQGTIDGLIREHPYFSIFYHVRSEAGVTVVMGVAAAAMVLLALGIWQRPTAIIVYIWHLSYTYRAFPATHGWDSLLRSLSFLLAVSPVSGVWSLGRRRRSEAPPALPAYGVNLVRLQLIVLYLNTLWLKVADTYWRNGEFFSYFMMSYYARFPHPVFARLESLSGVLTFGTLALELLLPVLLVIPRSRPWGVVLGLGFHLSIALVSKLTLFSLVMMIGYAAFLDSNWLERVECRARRWTRTGDPGTAPA